MSYPVRTSGMVTYRITNYPLENARACTVVNRRAQMPNKLRSATSLQVSCSWCSRRVIIILEAKSTGHVYEVCLEYVWIYVTVGSEATTTRHRVRDLREDEEMASGRDPQWVCGV
jgi:hypothetical protein